jgi:hypothetical protein
VQSDRIWRGQIAHPLGSFSLCFAQGKVARARFLLLRNKNHRTPVAERLRLGQQTLGNFLHTSLNLFIIPYISLVLQSKFKRKTFPF